MKKYKIFFVLLAMNLCLGISGCAAKPADAQSILTGAD